MTVYSETRLASSDEVVANLTKTVEGAVVVHKNFLKDTFTDMKNLSKKEKTT